MRRGGVLCSVLLTLGFSLTGGPPLSSAGLFAAPATRGPCARDAVALVLVTAPRAASSELHELVPGSTKLGRSLGRIAHAPSTLVKVAAVPGSSELVISSVSRLRRDLSFAASLSFWRAGQVPRALLEHLVHGVKPLVAGRQVFVVRGQAGNTQDDVAPARARRDQLSLDAVDLDSGSARTVFRSPGQLLLPLAVVDGAVILHRVADGAASFERVDLVSGRARTIAQVSPLARDFVLDAAAGAILFTSGPATGSMTGAAAPWQVVRLRLADGRSENIGPGPGPALFPQPWSDGGVLYAGAAGLTAVAAGHASALAPALGPGVDSVRATACHGGIVWAIGLHRAPGAATPTLFSFAGGASGAVLVAGVRGAIEVAEVREERPP